MRSIYCGLMAAAALAAARDGAAQGIRAVQPVPGYICMSLALAPEQMRSFSSLPVVKDAPSDAAKAIGVAGSVVIAKTAARLVNGYAEVLMPNRHVGWVKAGYLRSYHSNGGPNARCVPSIMFNGAVGFSG